MLARGGRVGSRWVALFVGVATLAAGVSEVRAQGGEADLLPPPPAPAPTPAPTPEAAPAGGAACTPACRDGYTCMEGACVDACNPPCPAGAHCTGAGACETDLPPPPPTYATLQPAYPEPLPAPPDLDAERHDGFMLRMALGFGGGTATEDAGGGNSIDYSGFAMSFSVDVGGAPIEDLVLHLRLADFVIIDPDVTLHDPVLGATKLGTVSDLSLAFLLLGPGLSYYFMPVNIYLTAALGMSWANVSDSTDSASSDMGIGVNFDVGKEWWVSDSWGIGLAGRFWYTHVTEESGGLSADLDFTAFGVLFSATYQ